MASQSYKCHLYVALPDQNNTRHGDAFYRFLIRQMPRTYMYCFRNSAKCASDFDWMLQSRAPCGHGGEPTRTATTSAKARSTARTKRSTGYCTG